MYTNDLKLARDKAAQAITAANGFAKQMRDEPTRATEHNASFDKAYNEFVDLQGEVQKLERLEDARVQYEQVQAPAAEKLIRRAGVDPKAEGFKALHSAAFEAFLKRGEAGVHETLTRRNAPEEVFALLGTQDDLGGFLVPEDFRAEIIKDLAGYAVVRQAGARVVPTSRDQLVFPTIKSNTGSGNNPDMYSSNVAGNWRVQGAQGTDGSAPARQNQPTFGQARIPVHIWQPDAIVVTPEFIADSAVDVDSILSELLAETKSLDEDSAFINGDGAVKPQGMANAGLTQVVSGHASLLKYGGLVDIYSDLPAQYRQSAAWLMNSNTFGAILKLESTGGFPLFPPNSLPGTLMGKQVFFSEFMPDVAVNSFPIIFGAFRYYVIAERQDFRIQRLVERFAPNVGILPTARLGGQVIRTAAFRRQKIST